MIKFSTITVSGLVFALPEFYLKGLKVRQIQSQNAKDLLNKWFWICHKKKILLNFDQSKF